MTVDLRPLRKCARRIARREKLLWVVVLVGAVLFLTLSVEKNLRPIAMQMAVTRAQYFASLAINRAVLAEVEREGVEYASLVQLRTDDSGRVTALSTDVEALNRLKGAVTDRALAEIAAYEPGELSVPLGNLINGELLSGRGPRIRVRMIPLGYATCETENSFESAGINQTRHRIFLRVRAELTVIIAGYGTTASVTTDVCVAETVIVGGVPENYTLITDEEIFDKYNNYLDE